MDPSWRKLRSYSSMANTQRKHALQLPTLDSRPSSSDIHGLPITTQKLTGLARVSPCLDALLSVEGGQMEAWQRTTDQNPEMRFMLRSSPLSGRNTTLGLQIPHCSGWPRKCRRLRLANPLRIWCRPNTTTSEMSSLRKPLMNSHHRRYGTTPLTSHLGLNSLTPRHSPCPLQNRRSLMTSSGRTLRMATVDGQDYISVSTPQSESRAGHKCIPADIMVLVPLKHRLWGSWIPRHTGL